jgi:hypothetical protein
MVFHPGFMWLLRARRTQLQRALLSIAIAPVSSLLAAGLNAVHHPVSPIGFEPSVGGYRNQGGQYQEQYASTPGAEFARSPKVRSGRWCACAVIQYRYANSAG